MHDCDNGSIIRYFEFPKVAQAHTLGELDILGTVLSRVYSATILPIFIDIGLCLTDTQQTISWRSFFWDIVYFIEYLEKWGYDTKVIAPLRRPLETVYNFWNRGQFWSPVCHWLCSPVWRRRRHLDVSFLLLAHPVPDRDFGSFLTTRLHVVYGMYYYTCTKWH